MDGPSRKQLLQNGNSLATGQPLSESNQQVNSERACDENGLKNHENGEIYQTPIREATQENQANESSQPVKRSKGRPRKTKQTFTGTPRVLRSRSQEKPKIPEPVEAPSQDADSKEKKRRKKKKINKDQKDEFSKIKTHLRYLIKRMSYEQNFIDAYVGEGWKGQSLEKLRPEKELERAKSDINRYKLKIRDLFKQIDTSLEEGRFPETLYDSDGLIDSEDIFCSKCAETDVRLDNDIILCDGACDRGFHQFCLDPPLLKEQVPPGDEGWLCPACDCKVDCVDLINETQGTDLSVNDSWEKVFPESVASGNTLDDDLGLPSDDSEDDDFNPDAPEVEDDGEGDGEGEEEEDGDDSSSDESDFSSASEDLGAVANNDPILALPSDDSEDDDFNPDKADSDSDGEAKTKSSGSDFTSDSDDLRDICKNEGTLDEVQGHAMFENDEETKTNMEDDDSGPITAKRQVERLDYKKLHDEAYGNTSSDSSDEDFSESDTEAPSSQKNRKPTKDTDSTKKQKLSESTPITKNGKKPDAEGSSADRSSAKTGNRSAHRRLGEAVTQRLQEVFKENQYPDKEAKEKLVEELKITLHQVTKWFGHARWNLNHPGKRTKAGTSTPEPNTNTNTTTITATPTITAAPTITTTPTTTTTTPEISMTNQVNVANSTTPKSRKRKTKADSQNDNEITPNLKEASPTVPPNQSIRRSGRVQAKRS
ncbi:Homeodomain-containing protein [Artemisia annua]|uniref:Homeodomain-containing protein n=1 Tax=Artemisia annua TaxID=35608 RepID=A0A2U1QNN3_ARTAN|nr:Homeodomain-containing protein [Artemisia annua]